MLTLLFLAVLLASQAYLVYSDLWSQIPGAMYHVDSGLTGDVWGIPFNSSGQIWKLKSADSGWTSIPGNLKQLSSGEGGLWGVDSAHQIWYREGSVANSFGSRWIKIPGGLTQISSGPYGVVYGVNGDDNIYCRTGITNSNPKGTGWQQIAGKLKYVSCGKFGCWGVNRGKHIFYRLKVSRDKPAGTSWVNIQGTLSQISTGPNGMVWGVNTADHIFYRAGVGSSNPTGSYWVSVPGYLRQVSIGCSGLYGTNKAGQVFRYTGSEGFSQSKCVKKAQKLVICENEKRQLKCSKGFNVLWANYGRTQGQQVCPGKIYTTQCWAASSLSKVRQKCEGKSSCDLHASNSVFGDPCQRTEKYLEVHYICGSEINENGGLQPGQIGGIVFACIVLCCFCLQYSRGFRKWLHKRRQRGQVQNDPPACTTASTADVSASASMPSPPTLPQAATKSAAFSVTNNLSPPPPYQDDWAAPVPAPPSYEEAIIMENPCILYSPGGRGREVRT